MNQLDQLKDVPLPIQSPEIIKKMYTNMVYGNVKPAITSYFSVTLYKHA